MTTYNLTPLEKKFCAALGDALDANQWGDGDWNPGDIAGTDDPDAKTYWTSLCGPDDIKWEDRQQLGGLLQSLHKKHVIIIEEYIEECPKVVQTSKHRMKVIVEKKRHVDIWGIAAAVRALAN